jgi:hypothetical protein
MPSYKLLLLHYLYTLQFQYTGLSILLFLDSVGLISCYNDPYIPYMVFLFQSKPQLSMPIAIEPSLFYDLILLFHTFHIITQIFLPSTLLNQGIH